MKASYEWDSSVLLNLISTSPTLAGLCITVVTVMNSMDKARSTATVVDDILCLCAAGFLVCTYLIFWALRTKLERTRHILVSIIDILFLVSISAMTIAAFIMIYTIW